MQNMPLYQCHKKVRAVKITQVNLLQSGAILYVEGHTDIPVTDAWLERNPEVEAGGYYVVYVDNRDMYSAYSPAEPFENGYTLMDDMEASDIMASNQIEVPDRHREQIKIDCLRMLMGSGLFNAEKAVENAEIFTNWILK